MCHETNPLQRRCESRRLHRGPNGETDWTITDPGIDFEVLMSGIDAVLMGRRTFEAAMAEGGSAMPGMKVFVVSRTLRQEDHPDLAIIGGALEVKKKSPACARSRAGTSGSSEAACSFEACSTWSWSMRWRSP